MKTTFSPQIGMFSPFEKPFAKRLDGVGCEVDPRILEYMRSDNAKIVAKCTPCQCCACR